MSSNYASHFGIDNIPFGIASSSSRPSPQCVTRIENDVVFLADLAKENVFSNIQAPLTEIFQQSTLNTYAGLPKDVHSQVRTAIQKWHSKASSKSFEPVDNVRMHLPVTVGDYTDFSASRDHMMNAGEAIFGVRSLPPAFHDYPCAYGGRSSSIRISGSPIERPYGQYIEDYNATEKKTVFGPERNLDYELEVGAVIGRPVKEGQRPKAADADEHIFGLVLLNDWSARGIQAFEMNPLGPFNGKNFGTSISPWIITLEALEPYRVPAPQHEKPVAPFMEDPKSSNYSLNLTVDVIRNGAATTTCKASYATMYWTFRQMLAHHTISGCGLKSGDILASGTVSGSGDDEHGCLLESTMGGKRALPLSDGSEMRYLEDGDVVRFTGVMGDGNGGVGFGECVGEIVHRPW